MTRMGAIELLLRAPTLLAPGRLADALLQDLAALPGPLILALDDYHAIKAPEIHALMARLVEHLPAHVHLVLITGPIHRCRWNDCAGASSLAKSVPRTCVSAPRKPGCCCSRCWDRE